MAVHTEYIEKSTSGNCEIFDITSDINNCVRKSGIGDGTATVFVPGATGALTTVEFEPGLVSDLKEAFEKLFPESHEYHHNLKWQDGNGHSHVRASFLGPSLCVPFVKGALILGTWQQIVFIDFDNRSRDRKIVVQIIGE